MIIVVMVVVVVVVVVGAVGVVMVVIMVEVMVIVKEGLGESSPFRPPPQIFPCLRCTPSVSP